MLWTTKALYGAAALTVASLWWAYSAHAERLRAEGRAEVAEAAVDSLTHEVELHVDLVERMQVRMDSVRENSDSIIAAAYARIAEVEASRPALVDSVIVEAGPDSTVVRQAIERVSASYELQISDLERATAAAEATMAAQDSLIRSLRAESGVKDALIANLRAQVEAVNRTNPGWVDRQAGKVVKVAVVVGVAWAGYEYGRHRGREEARTASASAASFSFAVRH